MTTTTDDDVRRALALEADDVMSVDQLRTRVSAARAARPRPHTVHRRRVLVPLAVAATAAALLTPAAVRALNPSHPHGVRAQAPTAALPSLSGPAFRLSTTVQLPSSLQVTGVGFSPRLQVIEIDPRNESDTSYDDTAVTTYSAGQFAEKKAFLSTATRTTVAGHVAYVGQTHGNVETVAWPFDGDRWVSVTMPEPVPGDTTRVAGLARAIAERVDTSGRLDVTSPMRLTYVPPGLHRDSASGTIATPAGFWGAVYIFTGGDRSLSVWAGPAQSRADTTITPNLTVNGHPAQYLARASASDGRPELRLGLGSTVVLIDGHYSKAELIAVARGLSLVPRPTDASTWLSTIG